MYVNLQKRQTHGMEKYFKNPEFSDCIVESLDGHQFPLHRIILAKSSEVFKDMLSSETNEVGKTRVIKIHGASSDLSRLFELIYTGETSVVFVTDLTCLIIIANKYKITDIEDLCAQKLEECIMPWNVVTVLYLAFNNTLKSSEKLKEKALECIGK